MSGSTGMKGAALAQSHLREILVDLDVHTLNKPAITLAQFNQVFDERGNILDEKTKEKMTEFLMALVDWCKRLGGGTI